MEFEGAVLGHETCVANLKSHCMVFILAFEFFFHVVKAAAYDFSLRG
jgi:hypothetical protein